MKILIKKGGITLNKKVISDFTEHLKNRAKSDYEREILKFGKYIKKDLDKADKEDAEKYIKHIRRKMAATTSVRIYRQLLSFYNHLYDNDMIAYNPFHKVKKPRASEQIKEERIPSMEEMKKLLHVIKKEYNHRDYVFTLLISTTGLRLKEAIQVKWSDFLMDRTGTIGLTVRKGTDHERMVKILPLIWEEFTRYREEFLRVSTEYESEDYYVFISTREIQTYKKYPASVNHMAETRIRHIYVDACKKAKIPLYTAKDLRHAHAVYALYMGADKKQIQDQLGWYSTKNIRKYDGVLTKIQISANDYTEKYFKELVKEEDEG